jgi:hypothetical protein
MALSFQLNVNCNSLKFGDILYIRQVIFIKKIENSVMLLKQITIHKNQV